MNAEIIAVGSELLTSKRIDTNSLWLTDQLNLLGVEVTGKAVIGDDRERLAAAVRLALDRADILIMTGGLGPTEDDLTRESVADALGRGLEWRQDLCDAIEARFRTMGRKMAEINRRQAYLVEGAEALPNPNGTAPGQWIQPVDGKTIMLLPGPPREMKPLFEQECAPRLREIVPSRVIRTLVFRVSGMPESDLDQLISPVYKEYGNPVTTVLAAPGDIQIHLRAQCDTEAEAERLLGEVGPRIEALLGEKIYSRDGRPLEAVVGDLLRQRKATLAVAESCTGGMLAERITSVAGASDYFRGGFLVYSADLKRDLLGVDAALIEQYTVVSAEVAEAMAVGARRKAGADYAIAVTGEAGPESGSGKPVGTLYLAVASSEGTTTTKHIRFPGDRERIRTLGAQWGLDLLRQTLAPSK